MEVTVRDHEAATEWRWERRRGGREDEERRKEERKRAEQVSSLAPTSTTGSS